MLGIEKMAIEGCWWKKNH